MEGPPPNEATSISSVLMAWEVMMPLFVPFSFILALQAVAL